MKQIHSVSPESLAGILISILLAFSPAAFSQSAGTDETAPGAPATMEEIIVYGDKSLSQLRRELHKASEAFFDVYNDLNSNDDFDILCDYQTKLGQRRREHICTPKFSLKAEARESTAWLLSGIQLQRSTGPDAGFNTGMGFRTPTARRVVEKEKLMFQEMSELLAQRPELREALVEVARAKNGYESERQRRKNE
jgi:hypothetical protein